VVVSDETLAQRVLLLRKAFGEDSQNPRYFSSVRGRGYRMICDVTPVGEAARRSKAKHGLIGAVLLAIAALLFFNILQDDSPPAPSENSIAVLPFVNLSSDEEQEWFADGLTEEILNALTQLPELHVTARTSSFFFKGQNIPVPDIAARLNVSNVVEGSVRRDREQVRITVQLIRASDGFHLWSATYDRTLVDVFDVQEDIAENIATALGVVLDGGARKLMRDAGIRDVEAFIAYQKGLEAFVKAHDPENDTLEGLAIANLHFDQALEAAPNLASIRILRADRAVHVHRRLVDSKHSEKNHAAAKDAIKALREELDLAWRQSRPGNQRDILKLEGAMWADDWSSLPDLIRKAMQPGRCPQMNITDGVYGALGWAEQIANKFRETLACNPFDVDANYSLPSMLVWAGDPEAALEVIEEAERKGLYHSSFQIERFHAMLAAGHADQIAMEGPWPDGDSWLVRRIMLLALTGDHLLAGRMAEEYWAGPNVRNHHSIIIAAVLGDLEQANKFAARIDAHSGGAVRISGIIRQCYCGAPFDLNATPNFRARIEESGISWPPASPINFPPKTW
jgi:TolB-like protein